mgnify:FL=1|tara:strand:+ start:634 stop:1401 length:768 start_codon:yes stop_codon:yes gene_type:complete
MSVQGSGDNLALNADIVAEFGGDAPHSISEYYDAASGIPANGEIKFSDFYGATDFDPSASGNSFSSTSVGSWSYSIPDAATNMRLEIVGGGGGGGFGSNADGSSPGTAGSNSTGTLSGMGTWVGNGGARGEGGGGTGNKPGGAGGGTSGPGIAVSHSNAGAAGGGCWGCNSSGGSLTVGTRTQPPFNGPGNGGGGRHWGGSGGTGGYLDTGYDALPSGTSRTISGTIGAAGPGDCSIRDGCASGGSGGAIKIQFT